MAAESGHLTVTERRARGKDARGRLPRSRLAGWSPDQRTASPLALLAAQAKTRVPELVPIRNGRMAASPFAYYRGAALPMAADLATTSHTGLTVQLCGDAHLSNFGGFASPERDMVFDVNDFDETLPGPFEWDVKRLAASLEIAARGRDFSRKKAHAIVADGVRSYRTAIRTFAGQSNLAVWYARLDVEAVMKRWGASADKKVMDRVRHNVAGAQARDQLKARRKLTRVVHGRFRFVSDPPLLVPIDELMQGDERQDIEGLVDEALRGYRRTLSHDLRHLLDSYRLVDIARKVVGVGSVGTRAWVTLSVGRDTDDTLILQLKEAEASVLERFVGKSAYRNHGQRVVEGQRLQQAATDILLGWQRVTDGVDGRRHDYYVRQLWDWKFSPDVATMGPELMASYAEMCGWTLARAHARSGDAIAIDAYLGSSGAFDGALVDFAHAYANQNEVDHQALVDAIAAGEVKAETGV